jgi:serine/threonine-protein kinase
VLPGAARAQSGADPVAARTLFQDARKLMAESKYEQACPKLEESLNLDPGIGTMFNLADCWEHVGRTASAWSRFLDAASAAKNAGQAGREKVARDRAAALEPHLSRLTIAVAVAPPGLEVHDGGRSVAASLFGTAIPVDPGAHTIEAKAPGKKPWQGVVQVAAGGGSVSVTVPPLATDDTAVAAPVVAPVAAPGSASESMTVSTADSSRGGTQRVAGWVTASLGVVGLAVGAGLGLAGESKNNQAKALCPSLSCTQSVINQHTMLVNSAQSMFTSSYVGFAAGGAAVVGGLALVLTAPRGHSEGLAVAPVVGLDRRRRAEMMSL